MRKNEKILTPIKKRKTERAIAELIRERLKATNDLAAQVAAAGPDMYWEYVDQLEFESKI